MDRLTEFDPNNPAGVFAFDTGLGPQASDQQLYVWNVSNVALLFTLAPARRCFIPPMCGYPIGKRPYPMPRITWAIDYVLNASSAPASKVTVEVYEAAERMPSEQPIPLSFLTNIGNASVPTSTTTGLVNDGNGPGTQIIESTPSDQPGQSSIAENNDGSGFRKILSAGALRTVLNIVRGNSGSTHAIVDIGDALDFNMSRFHGRLDSVYSDSGKLQSDGANGTLARVGNMPTAGGVGVPAVGFLTKSIAVTTVGSATIATWVPGFDGYYRVNVYLRVNNSVSGQTLSCSVFWTELDTLFATSQVLTLNGLTLDGTHGIANGAYGLASIPILVKGGLNDIHIVYNDPGGTPNDKVTVGLEFLG